MLYYIKHITQNPDFDWSKRAQFDDQSHVLLIGINTKKKKRMQKKRERKNDILC